MHSVCFCRVRERSGRQWVELGILRCRRDQLRIRGCSAPQVGSLLCQLCHGFAGATVVLPKKVDSQYASSRLLISPDSGHKEGTQHNCIGDEDDASEAEEVYAGIQEEASPGSGRVTGQAGNDGHPVLVRYPIFSPAAPALVRGWS